MSHTPSCNTLQSNLDYLFKKLKSDDDDDVKIEWLWYFFVERASMSEALCSAVNCETSTFLDNTLNEAFLTSSEISRVLLTSSIK